MNIQFHRFKEGDRIDLDYRNHRGSLERRTLVFQQLEFGRNEYYPEEQFLLRCYCLDRKAERSFAVQNISMIYSVGDTVFWERTGNGYRRPE